MQIFVRDTYAELSALAASHMTEILSYKQLHWFVLLRVIVRLAYTKPLWN